jgi:hypothetical protein
MLIGGCLKLLLLVIAASICTKIPSIQVLLQAMSVRHAGGRVPFAFALLPVPTNMEYDVGYGQKLTTHATPSGGSDTDMLVESGRAPGGVSVDVGGCVSLEVGDVVECVCVCVCWGVAFSGRIRTGLRASIRRKCLSSS